MFPALELYYGVDPVQHIVVAGCNVDGLDGDLCEVCQFNLLLFDLMIVC